MLVELVVDDVPYRVRLARDGAAVRGDVDGQAFEANVRPLGGTRFEVTIDGKAVEVDVATNRSAFAWVLST